MNMVFMSTVRSIGEASRKLSSCKAGKSGHPRTMKSNSTRFGKAKWLKGGDQPDLE
jgi:hypothetical protein